MNGISGRCSERPRACSRRGRFITNSTRPSAGHVSRSFLALVLKKELEDRIANLDKRAAGRDAAPCASWPEILADRDWLTETEVKQRRQALSPMLGATPRRERGATRRRRR